jgi:hypothetical protein
VLTAQQPVATESAFLCEDEPQFLVGRISSGKRGRALKLRRSPLVCGEVTGMRRIALRYSAA